jgi:hypothetical protein
MVGAVREDGAVQPSPLGDGTVRHSILQRGVWRDGWVGTLLAGELRD